MHEEHYTNLLEQLNAGLKELETANQFIQQTLGNVDAIKERIGELMEISEKKSRKLEMLHAQFAGLGISDDLVDEDASPGPNEAPQLKRQGELEEELSSYMEELEQGLNSLYISVEELYQSVKEGNETLLAPVNSSMQNKSELPAQENILLYELKELKGTIEERNQKAYSQAFVFNEQQIKLLSGQEKLIQQLRQQSRSNIRWFPALGVGIFATLALCLALFFKGPDQSADAGLADEELITEPITARPGDWPIDSADPGLQKKLPGIPTADAVEESRQQDTLRKSSVKEKSSIPAPINEVKAKPENEQAKEPATSLNESGLVTEKGLSEDASPPLQLLSPQQAKNQIAPRDEFAIIYLEKKNFDRLALKYIHSEKGIHFFPFGLETPGKIFSAAAIKDALSNSDAYHWGSVEGAPLEMDFQTYYSTYIIDEDFSDGAERHYNEVHFPGKSGLSAAQLAQRFPDGIFVEFCKSGKSLVLVFERQPNGSDWGLSAVIHNH